MFFHSILYENKSKYYLHNGRKTFNYGNKNKQNSGIARLNFFFSTSALTRLIENVIATPLSLSKLIPIFWERCFCDIIPSLLAFFRSFQSGNHI